MSLIPERPGADWRDLPNVVWELPDGTRTGENPSDGFLFCWYTKNHNFVTIYNILRQFGTFYVHLVNLMVIWYFSRFGMLYQENRPPSDLL
jgi:hypothetical protein